MDKVKTSGSLFAPKRCVGRKDVKTQLLFQLDNLKRQIKAADVEKERIGTLEWMTRSLQDLEKLNQSVALATFLSNLDQSIPAISQFNQTMETVARTFPQFRLEE